MMPVFHRPSFDARSLVIFRIAIGISVLIMLASRLLRFEDFYGVQGLMPLRGVWLSALRQQLIGPYWAAHFWFDSDAWTLGLMALTGVAAVSFALGVATRFIVGILLYLALSHNVRFPMVHGGFETYLPWLLIFCLLLNLVRGSKFDEWSVAAYGGFVGLTYWIAGFAKNSESWRDGSALNNYFQPSAATTPLANYLTQYDGTLRFFTFAIPWFEIAVPILVVGSMFLWPRCRAYLVLLMLGFHGLISLCLHVSEISLMSAICWLPFLPTEFWRMVPRWKLTDKSAVQPRKTPKVCAIAMLIVLLLGFADFAQSLSRREGQTFINWNHLKAVGVEFNFFHFAKGETEGGWVQVVGRKDNWLEILLPWHKVTAVPDEPWPQDLFQTRYGGDRLWMKLINGLGSANPPAMFVKSVERYLCRHYGPQSTHGMIEFKWIVHVHDPSSIGRREIRHHDCRR